MSRRTVGCRIYKALLARSLYLTVSILMVWRLVIYTQSNLYWLLALLAVPLVGEALYMVIARTGREFKWVSSSTICYLIIIVPCVWLTQFDLLQYHVSNHEQEELTTTVTKNVIETSEGSTQLDSQKKKEAFTAVVEQVILLLIVFNSWLLRKATHHHEEVAQLALMYVGIMADILEILNTLDDELVVYSTMMTSVVLSLWSFSILQFCLTLTAKKRRKEDDEEESLRDALLSSDLWAMLVGTTTLDLPMFAFRMTLIFHFHELTRSLFFYTIKNACVILLTLYSVVAMLVAHVKKQRRLRSKRVESVAAGNINFSPDQETESTGM